MSDMPAPVPMESRHTRLAPPTPPFLDHLYRLAATGLITWQWDGMAETPDAFYSSLSKRTLIVHAIIDKRTGAEIGLLVAYDANVFHGFAYVSMYLLPEYQRKVWPNEAALLFGNLLFVRFNLRNLYAQSAEPDFAQFSSGEGSFFDVEGHLQGRLLVDGVPQDLYILTLSRERWEEVGVPLLRHCTGLRGGGPSQSDGPPSGPEVLTTATPGRTVTDGGD